MAEKSRDEPPMSTITEVLADLQRTARWQEQVYKQLHANPELSFQETKTAARTSRQGEYWSALRLDSDCR